MTCRKAHNTREWLNGDRTIRLSPLHSSIMHSINPRLPEPCFCFVTTPPCLFHYQNSVLIILVPVDSYVSPLYIDTKISTNMKLGYYEENRIDNYLDILASLLLGKLYDAILTSY